MESGRPSGGKKGTIASQQKGSTVTWVANNKAGGNLCRRACPWLEGGD